MSLVLPLIGLAASGIGYGIQASKNAEANRNDEAAYSNMRGRLLTDIYSSPFDDPGNNALLSKVGRRLDKSEEAVANQAAAGGATFENTLAAKQAGNELLADMGTSILQADTARKDAFRNQLLNLDSQRAAQRSAALRQAGAGWASLANGVAGSLNTLGGTMLENDIPLKDLFKFR